MTLIHVASRLFGASIAEPSSPSLMTSHHRQQGDHSLGRLRSVSWLTGVGFCLSLLSAPAWGQSITENSHSDGRIVAAGFGYQIGESSTITVKVYDAVSGEVLSDEVFELNVNEDGNTAATEPQDRIFAGGVGLGATDLSNFVLRVYDAKTGKFQWEGKLNLTPADEGNAGKLVSTVVPRRATIMKIHNTESTTQQPLFSLRALDGSTGGLVWEDEFLVVGGGASRAQQIAHRKINLEGSAVDASPTFDFRIRMFDRNGKTVLWEDQVLQEATEEEETLEATSDQARLLPAWPWQFEQDPTPVEI
jgi:hypothetical protein